MIGVSVSSLRNYCSTFAQFLSAEAAPAAGKERRLSQHDVAILQRVVELRGMGLDTAGIVATLQGEDLAALMPYINATIEPATPTAPPQPAPVATVGADVLQALQKLADDRYDDLVRRVAEVEAKQWSLITMFVWGFLAGLICVLVVLAVLWAGANFR